MWFSDGGTKAEIKLFAFDSTGLKPTNRGVWMPKKWGTLRGFIKLHVSVDAKTKIYAVAITNDKCGDSPQFERLVEQALANAEKSPNADISTDMAAAGDGAYDTQKIRRYCNEQGIHQLIPIRIDFAGKANGGMPHRRQDSGSWGVWITWTKWQNTSSQSSHASKRENFRRRGAESQGTMTGG